MLTRFEKKVAEFIKTYGLFGAAEKVLLAVSGGPDSTALLYVMRALKASKILSVELSCAHIHHRLRGAEADGDENFVIAEAGKLNLPVTTRRVEVREFAHRHKLSIETSARKMRIEALIDIARVNTCQVIATGHQKNDNAETILQRLIRGTGYRGLGGIWPGRIFAGYVSFVRPLLCVTRDEIIDYLRAKNLKWRQDHSNVDYSYRRNFIRHRLIPALQKRCTGSIEQQLFDLSIAAQKLDRLICSQADDVWPDIAESSGEKVLLSLERFLDEPDPVKVELIRRSLTNIGSGERDLTHRHYERILQLAKQKVSGRKIELPAGFVVRKEYGKLFFARTTEISAAKADTDKSVRLKVPGSTRFGSYLIEAAILETDNSSFEEFKAGKNNLVERFDLDKLKLPLTARFHKKADRFWPLGLPDRKKVGKFLTAAKVPHQIRQTLLIITDSEKIIWVWPVRISELTKITHHTQNTLQLQITAGDSLKVILYKDTGGNL